MTTSPETSNNLPETIWTRSLSRMRGLRLAAIPILRRTWVVIMPLGFIFPYGYKRGYNEIRESPSGKQLREREHFVHAAPGRSTSWRNSWPTLLSRVAPSDAVASWASKVQGTQEVSHLARTPSQGKPKKPQGLRPHEKNIDERSSSGIFLRSPASRFSRIPNGLLLRCSGAVCIETAWRNFSLWEPNQ